MKHFTLGILALIASTTNTLAQTTVEEFTGGSNQGGWTWGAGDQIVATGGNPGAYLRTTVLDTFAPQPRTSAGTSSVFTGGYRARGVTSVGIDLVTMSTQFPFAREVTLMLENDAGTPGNTSDDFVVYRITPGFVPQPGAGWASFDVNVPSQSTVLPAGWQVLQGAGTADAVWNSVLTNVSRVRWFYGDPTFFFIFDIWQVGMDNPRITEGIGTAFCFGDSVVQPCPCANASPAPGGCANSTGLGAYLSASGSASLAANDLVLAANSLPSSSPTLLFQGTTQTNGGNGVVFGDGLRCVGGSTVRLGTRVAVAGTATFGPGLAHGTAVPTTLYFQAWYRNVVGPCGSGWNLSSARSIAFTP